MQVIAGDIGGTNTRLVLAEVNGNDRLIQFEKSYTGEQFSDFVELLETFLSEYKFSLSVKAACFAVAGPVKSGVVSVTNNPWVISEVKLRRVLGTPNVVLINDFSAVGYGVPLLEHANFVTLQQGHADENKSEHQNAAVIGAGTGLGVSQLICREGRCMPHSSEAGHVGFAPENRQQRELLAWLQQQNSHVSIEMLLSGTGLLRIYNFLHELAGISESSTVIAAMRDIDPAQVITEHALLEDDELCMKTLDLFLDIYGSAAGNVALHYYPIGDLYIAGGIAAKISSKMADGRFIDAFLNKGKISSILKNITVKVITQEKVGLYGALSYAWTRHDTSTIR
ncbi:MAG: glucokinase [Pseudomonadota bacterium]|nr:glucokinase [Pseudomonadota bacterium]